MVRKEHRAASWFWGSPHVHPKDFCLGGDEDDDMMMTEAITYKGVCLLGTSQGFVCYLMSLVQSVGSEASAPGSV